MDVSFDHFIMVEKNSMNIFLIRFRFEKLQNRNEGLILLSKIILLFSEWVIQKLFQFSSPVACMLHTWIKESIHGWSILHCIYNVQL